jgi:hypothetical protein
MPREPLAAQDCQPKMHHLLVQLQDVMGIFALFDSGPG